MSPVAHLQYGWWIAHWARLDRRERAVVSLAGAGPDLDGLSFLAGSDSFHRYHHILFHNLGAVAVAGIFAAIVLRRRPFAALLATLAFLMHIAEDYVTVGWNQYPWQPLSAVPVNLADHLPAWAVQGVLQTAAMAFILWMTVRIYIRDKRTPLEILSPALDRLLIGYAVLPFRARCAVCGVRAHFRCEGCEACACASHVTIGKRLAVRCKACTAAARAAQASSSA